MKRIVEPAVSGPVTVRVADQEISLPVSAYAPALSVRVVGVALRPHLDPSLLAGPLTNATTGLAKEAVNASFVIENDKPVIKPAKPGVGLRPEEMAVKLIPAITQTGRARSVTVDSKVVPPTFTTADAEALNIREKISEFVTYFPYARYRNINQSRAASLINGTILKPDETFSLNDTVGERSKDNGFVKGIVIGEGATFVEQYGGAVSQVATTVYNAAFFAGLEDVEHHPHTFYIGRYPLGREATVWWGKLDLRFKNTLSNAVLIRAWVVKGSDTRRGEMHVEMWGTKEWDISSSISDRYNEREPGKRYNDTDECIEQDPMEGFDLDVTRIFRKPGSREIEKTDVTHVSYVPSDEILCEAPPTPTPTPAPWRPQPAYPVVR
jgi:vancomycin resistance protein YoaR